MSVNTQAHAESRSSTKVVRRAASNLPVQSYSVHRAGTPSLRRIVKPCQADPWFLLGVTRNHAHRIAVSALEFPILVQCADYKARNPVSHLDAISISRTHGVRLETTSTVRRRVQGWPACAWLERTLCPARRSRSAVLSTTSQRLLHSTCWSRERKSRTSLGRPRFV